MKKGTVHMKNRKLTLKQNKNMSYKNQLMLSYTLILAIILMIGVILYSLSYRQVKNGIYQQNRLSLTASVNQLDNTLELMNASVKQITANSLFNNLINQKDREDSSFYYLGYKTQQSLKSITPVELLLPISNSFIYIEKSSYAISPILFSDFDFFIWHNTKYPIDPAQFSKILVNPVYWNKFIPFEQLGTSSKNFLYLYPLTSASQIANHSSSVICYQFDHEKVIKYFSSINFYNNGYLVAYDKNGNQTFLLSGGGPVIDYDTLKNMDFEHNIAHFTQGSNREEMLITTVSSSYNNWNYYLIQPEEKAYYSITPYQRFFTTVTLAAIILGGILAVIFSSFGNQKILKLSNELNIKESLASSLNLLVEKQKPVVAESYMRRIMEGSITNNVEMQYIIDELGLERPDTKFHVLYTEVSPSEESDICTKDLELCFENYDMLVREALRRYYPDTGYIYKPSDRAFAILIASGESLHFEQVLEQSRNTFISMHNELLQKYGIWIRGGLGSRNGLISYTWKSYQQAKEAKSVTTTEKYILSRYDFIKSNDVYYYPESLSIQLSGFISTGNKEQVKELFKLIRDENTSRRSLSFTQQKWLLSDIRSTVFKKRHSITEEGLLEDRLKLLDMIDKQFEGEISIDSLKTIALELCDVCGTETESNELIIKIQDYIVNNYHDPDLCLTKISDIFGISENYFSYLFKREVSENFSTYLERLRMAKAKEIISTTDTSLSTLYEYLGYNNAASFRRAFKKNFGVSPKEMRDKTNAK
ncbi:MAG: helix-turn-helix transcriptional regulator [Hungatella sp.]|nr:helix-turn-helix transcriptional regulator [Hungatella sp.]